MLADKDLIGNDDKVRLYTGVPRYATPMRAFELSPHGSYQHQYQHCTTSLFSQLLTTLMKLCLKMLDYGLGYRFGMHQSPAPRPVLKWINIMHTRLRPLVRWPEPGDVVKICLLSFQRHSNDAYALLIALKCIVNGRQT